MGAIVIRTRYDEGTESAEVATSDIYIYIYIPPRPKTSVTNRGPHSVSIQIINRYIYTIFWGGNFEYLQRKSLIQPFCNGGQQVPDIQTKINALLLNRITQVLKGNNSAWTSIFSYFLGYTTRDILPELALNYVQHTIQTIGTQYKQ